jgi:hypothetical protein
MGNTSGVKYAWLMVLYTNVLFFLFMITEGFNDFEIGRIAYLPTYLPIIGVFVGTILPMYVAQASLSRKSLVVKLFVLIVSLPTIYYFYLDRYICENQYCGLANAIVFGTGVFLLLSFFIFYRLGILFQKCSEKIARNLSIIIPISILGLLLMIN